MPKMPEKPKDFGPFEVLRITVDADDEGIQPAMQLWFKGLTGERVGQILGSVAVITRMALEQLPPQYQEQAVAAFMEAAQRDKENPIPPDIAESYVREREIDP